MSVIVVRQVVGGIVVIQRLGGVQPGLEYTANSVWQFGFLSEKLKCGDILIPDAVG